jgi:hypothetical protein
LEVSRPSCRIATVKVNGMNLSELIRNVKAKNGYF